MASGDITPLVAGNWKMNGLAVSEGQLANIINGAGVLAGKADLMICPPATLIASFAGAARGSNVLIGGQDCHAEPSGPHTGDIAAEMIKDAGAVAVICVALLTTKPVAAAAPKWTAVAPVRLLPVMMTALPPEVGPLAGLTALTTGAVA